MMSSAPNSAAEPEFGASVVAKPEGMLAGFPWVSAIVLYTLSWGWSLLRPNTLYWDDWYFFWRKPLTSYADNLHSMGYPPWAGLLEFALLNIGIWAVTLATFFYYLGAGAILFILLKSISSITTNSNQLIVILFLSVPVTHARFSITESDDASSYFLFFLGWLLLVRDKSWKYFSLACTALLLSFKTHSVLFFLLLPLLHFVWLDKEDLKKFKKLTCRHLQVVVIAIMPLAYIVLRELFWPPTASFQDYQRPTAAGTVTALWPVLFGLLGLSIIGFRHAKNRQTHLGWVLLVVGFSITTLALFPYFAGEFYVGYAGRPAYVTVFEFRADWRSRYQLLMPLGLALSVVGLNDLLKWKGKNIVASFVLVVSVALNMFWGSQYFLMSHKQEQLVELFKDTKGEVEIASVADQTLRFNGRESTFRGYEWSGFMTLAGISTDRPGCDALPSGSVLTLKSETSYLKALATRDLGLYFEVKPCSEVLAQNG
jgi:hypothetical protein